jgi:hypothetical protein
MTEKHLVRLKWLTYVHMYMYVAYIPDSKVLYQKGRKIVDAVGLKLSSFHRKTRNQSYDHELQSQHCINLQRK